MAYTNNNVPLLHRKEWQMMNPVPITTGIGMFMVEAGSSNQDLSLYVTSATVQYLYSHSQDGFMQIPSGALAGTFGAGASGAYTPWSLTYTANGGSTTTVTVAAATHNINNFVLNKTIEFLNGTNLGLRRIITNVRNNAGAGTVTLTLDSAVSASVVNTDTFRVGSGRFFCMSSGTTAAGSYKYFDLGTLAWSGNLVITNFPATNSTDGKLVSTAKLSSILANGTATSGATNTVTDTTKSWTVDAYKNQYIFIISGTGKGEFLKILDNTATAIRTISNWAVTPDNTSVYQVCAGKPGFASGVATSATGTTLVNTTKTWTVDQWINYQVRIVFGTGRGQIRNITDSDATSLTVAAWSVNPDSTSVYCIEGNEDFIYFAGAAAVTLTRYSISANTWTTLAPTSARGGSAAVGMCLDWVSETGNSVWANENDIQDGRYIYSLRGGSAATLDRFDIAGGTAGAGAWTAVTYITAETFASGSSSFQSQQYLYIRKDATHRYFRFDIVGNMLEPLCINLYTDGGAVPGQKIWVKNLDETESVRWLYSIGNTLTTLHRIMLY